MIKFFHILRTMIVVKLMQIYFFYRDKLGRRDKLHLPPVYVVKVKPESSISKQENLL